MKTCQQCKLCGKCGKPYSSNSTYAEKCKDFNGKKLTRFEKIKQMNIDEMTDLIDSFRNCSRYIAKYGTDDVIDITEQVKSVTE